MRSKEGQITTSVHAPASQPVRWSWPLIDQPVDVNSLILREWKHVGDSPIIAARPRKQRGAPLPTPAYLLKVGRDAIGERLYSLAARHFDLPSAVVYWTTSSDIHEAAIRFEPEAWRPRRIEPARAVAITEEQTVTLRNPLDYYRHLALSDVLGENDGAEFMVCRELLFRIDAAATGWSLFSFYLGWGLQATKGDSGATQEGLLSSIRTSLDHLRSSSPPGYQMYLDMVAEIVAWAEMPRHLADDLRACPAAAFQFLPAGVREALNREIPTLADTVEAYLGQQQQALKILLSSPFAF